LTRRSIAERNIIAANTILILIRSSMPIIDADVTSEFPGTVGGPYLDTAARGLLPRSAHAAITASLERVLMGK
jgi:hypothetical protein